MIAERAADLIRFGSPPPIHFDGNYNDQDEEAFRLSNLLQQQVASKHFNEAYYEAAAPKRSQIGRKTNSTGHRKLHKVHRLDQRPQQVATGAADALAVASQQASQLGGSNEWALDFGEEVAELPQEAAIEQSNDN